MLKYLRLSKSLCFQELSISAYTLNVLVAIWFTLAYNMPFLLGVYSNISGSSLETSAILLVVTLCVFLLNYLLVVCLNVKTLFKPSLVLFFLASSILFYSNSTGKQYNPSAFEINHWLDGIGRFLSFSFVLNMIFLFLLPTIVLAKIKVKWDGTKQHAFKTLGTIFLLCLSLFSIYQLSEVRIKPFYQIARPQLVKVIPTHFIDSSIKYLRHQYFEPVLMFSVLDNAPVLIDSAQSKTVVLIIGESVRADSFNASSVFALDQQIGQKSTVSACDTYAKSSTQCIFSLLSRTRFNDQVASHQQNVLDILSLSGVNIHWLSNNRDCGVLCKRANVTEHRLQCTKPPCFDHELIDKLLVNILSNSLSPNQSNLIIIQTQNIGSPLYSRFYPRAYATLTPECNTLLVANCDKAALVNSYQNAVEYMEYVLVQANSALDEFHRHYPHIFTSLIFTSKYGESLGEKGQYFHGSPKSVAPSEQLLVPLLIVDKQLPINCLSTLNENLSHDVVSHTLLGYFGIRTKVYSAKLDVAALCTQSAQSRQQKLKQPWPTSAKNRSKKETL